MTADRFEQIRIDKENEARKFYESYNIETDENFNVDTWVSYPYFSTNEIIEPKTIKLSNSTIPIACY